jgi:hypothetical protein
MLYKITNTGEARTVDFLAVFAKGETKFFTEDELRACQHMSGIPLDSLLGGDDSQFDFAKDQADLTKEDLEKDAVAQQEATVAQLNGQVLTEANSDAEEEAK